MWGLVAVVTCPWARGPRRVPPGGGISGGRLQLVQEVVQGWDAFLQAFALACLSYYLTGAAGVVKGVTGQDLPVVEHTLGEGLAAHVGPPVSSEAKGLINRQVGLHDKRGASQLGLLEDLAQLPVQDTIRSDQIRSVAQSCLTLCDPMNRSTPGLPVYHQLPEFTQTHVH